MDSRHNFAGLFWDTCEFLSRGWRAAHCVGSPEWHCLCFDIQSYTMARNLIHQGRPQGQGYGETQESRDVHLLSDFIVP